MIPHYLEDLHPGLTFASTEQAVEAERLDAFLARYATPHPALMQPIFVSDFTMRLLVQGGAPLAGGIVGAGVENVSWPTPVSAGDALHVETEILEVNPSRKRPDVGRVKVRARTLNQRGEAVHQLTASLMVPRRPSA
jgi:acyl dehydratase